MANNFSKLWLQKTQNELAINRAAQAIKATGRALPCRVVSVNGSIVTVAFEVDSSVLTLPQITIPKAESQWIRTPTQVGDFGVTVPADVYLGGVSGLGGGTANFAQRGNLSALQFLPIANKNFSSVDPNAAFICGPNGAVICNTQGTQTLEKIDQDGYSVTRGSNSIVMDGSSITLTVGGKVVTLDSSGLTIDGILFDTHTHNVVGVQPGGATIPSQGPQG